MVDKFGHYRREMNDNSNTNHPSFSSTLLDEIYRSIDQGEDQKNIDVMYGETMRRKKQQATMFPTQEEIANFQRACMIEKWMENKVREKAAARRKSTAVEAVFTSSSWDSSGGGGREGAGFLSESFYEKRPKPIRVCDSGFNKEKPASKNQDGFMKTKSRALKIYADLKKVKQPISPGARLAGFLNSLFAVAGNTKKPKMSSNPETKSANASTCSSASSFSRSCLSKTPSSRGKSAGGEKRSVRFSPVTGGEDFQACGHKSLQEETNFNSKKQNLEAINEEMMVHVNIIENDRRVEEAARDFLRNYQKNEFRFDHLTKSHDLDQELEDEDEDEDEYDDDAASYASSDLFELDNLSAIGMERYREELPVYETTHLHTNRAIASGLIL